MMSITSEQIELLPNEELRPSLKALLAELESLRQRVAELEAENQQLKQRLDKSTNSRNSSQPPSRDQKPNQPADKPKKKHDARFGHQKFSRPLVDKPDHIIQVPVTECEHCHEDLRGVEPEDFTRRQIVELPKPKPLIGPNLEATVITYKQKQHVSVERVVETMNDLHGVKLSEGAVCSILERAGKRAEPQAEAIKKQVIAGEVIRSDETSARVLAKNWWQWVFISENGVYHTIVPTRSFAEIETVLGELAVKAWVSDCFGAQLKTPAEVFQLCLSHQLRDIQKVLDATPEELWAQAAQKLFREAIHLRNRFQSGEMKPTGFSRRVTEIENKLDRLLEKELANEAAEKLRKRFVKHRDKLLTFLHYPAVPPTNNESDHARTQRHSCSTKMLSKTRPRSSRLITISVRGKE